MGVFERDRKNQRKWEITDFTDHTDQHDRESDRSIWETFFCQLLKRLYAKAPQTNLLRASHPGTNFAKRITPGRRCGGMGKSIKAVNASKFRTGYRVPPANTYTKG